MKSAKALISKGITAILLAFILSFVLVVPSLAANEPQALAKFVAPAGEEDYTFSIALSISESEAYAGIQFDLKFSDEADLMFVSFSLTNVEVVWKNGEPYPHKFLHGVHTIGFWSGENVFSSENTKTAAGVVTFKYSGKETQQIWLAEKMVMRIVDGNPVGVRTQPMTLLAEITRAESGPGTPPDDDDRGVTGGGGSGDTQTVTIEEDEVPLAEYEVKSKYFDDVPEEKWPWAVDEIDYLFEHGVINGTSTRIYSPASNIKRGDFMLMLARTYELVELAGEFEDNFSDVPEDSYYYDALGAAKKLGIAEGVGDNRFDPEAPITRQDMMVLVDRTLRELGEPLPDAPLTVLDGFADHEQVAGYAEEAVARLVQTGIIKGDDRGINPRGLTTRAEMAVVVYRLITTL